MDVTALVLVIAVIVVPVLFKMYLPEMRAWAGDRGLLRRARGSGGYEPPPEGSRSAPSWAGERTGSLIAVMILVLIVALAVSRSVVRVPAGHRGVLLTLGKVHEVNLDEGLHIIVPWQNVINMPVMIQKAEITESTASNDLQEITTQLAVHYRVREDSAWIVYQTMRMNYLHLLVEPVIMEELKATTADWSAEQLITDRPLVVIQLQETLDNRLQPYGIDVMTVNFIDFQFSKEFWDAIERKVVATQDALTERNKVEIARFQQQQAIITAEGQYNVTVIRANADAQQKIISATAEARRITIEANATATAIKQITSQMTPQYAQYLYLTRWDGILPSTLLGGLEDIGLIIDTTR
jgi:regulator of protease activity HflC (stomatin/prohibitin superfamily)